MQASAFLNNNPNPSDEEIDAVMDGNICRCGTYNKIRKAIKTAASAGVQTFDPSKEIDHGDSSTAEEIV